MRLLPDHLQVGEKDKNKISSGALHLSRNPTHNFVSLVDIFFDKKLVSASGDTKRPVAKRLFLIAMKNCGTA